jgi:hypothetical protein
MIRIIIPFEILHVIFRVYFLIYFIYFRLEDFFEKNFKLSGFTKSINTQNKYSERVFIRGDLIRAITREALIEYEYFFI